MPIYEYRCQQCGQRFEKLVLSVDREPATLACPGCDSEDVQRLISRVAVSSGQAETAGEPDQASAAKPAPFGRKELQQAIKNRGY